VNSYVEANNAYFHDTLKKRTAGISGFPTLEEAAQTFVEGLYADFSSSVLVRLYTTIPYSSLSPSTKQFADKIAKSAGVNEQLRPETNVLCLMGTTGKRSAWRDRTQSRGHLAIPLVSSKFVEKIPMITRLLNEFGIGLDWLNEGDQNTIIAKSMGRMATVFYVPDAATFRDSMNRLVIPMQDFVSENNVKTVFGVGGAYANNQICAVLFFVSETLDRTVVDRFLPIVNFFKHSTTHSVMGGRLFSRGG
jgi:hypothetical protein